MDNSTEPIRQDIDDIRASMTEKMERIESKIKGSVNETTDSVKRMVDVKHQVAQRPWAAFGLSLAAGFALGSLGSDDEDERRREYQEATRAYRPTQHQNGPQSSNWNSHTTMPGYEYTAPATYQAQTASGAARTEASAYRAPNGHQTSKPSLFDSLSEQFGDEIEMLKGVAVSSLVGMLRDTIRQNFPSVYDEAERRRSGQSYERAGVQNGDTTGNNAAYARSAANNPPHVAGVYDSERTSDPTSAYRKS